LKPQAEIARCSVPQSVRARMRNGWLTVAVRKGRLLWRPERITENGIATAVAAVVQPPAGAVAVTGLPSTWRVRQYRDGNRLLIHAIPAQVETVLHAELRDQFSHENVIQKLRYTPLTGTLVAEPVSPLSRVVLHSPDLPEPRNATGAGKSWTVSASGVSRYFVLECIA
jgi:hypothetical protein